MVIIIEWWKVFEKSCVVSTWLTLFLKKGIKRIYNYLKSSKQLDWLKFKIQK